MTEKELYFQMLPMAVTFDKYKAKQLSALTPDEVGQMASIFKGVQMVYPISGLPRLFTASCTSCVINTLEKFISIFDRIKTIHQELEEPKVGEPEPPKKKGRKKNNG